jgi:uncharacterized damage-inducible protein DinB
MKKIALWVLFLASAHVTFAQDSGKILVGELVKHWQTSKTLSLEVAGAMPEDGYTFKATPAQMSFGEQINHIALGATHYCSAAMGSKSPLAKADDNTKATATKNLTTAYDFCIDGLKEMTDADLQKMVKQHDSSVSRFELFWGGFTHSAHHRGQAEVYLRLKGVTPPDYQF